MTEALLLGDYRVDVPVVLAPMAGITNRAFRRLCREQGGGIYVCEMVTARALVEGNEETLRMASFDEDESPRSLQLYGTDPATVADAVTMVTAKNMADHIDLNMGCPVPKVTRKGGGAALPWKLDLFSELVGGAVAAARRAAHGSGRSPVPVTVKMRMGIDVDHLSYREAGRIAAELGVAWVALHGRTAAQHYGGQADWSAIATLVTDLAEFGIPVLGNGDIWAAGDAKRMMEHTGCAGVVVGRGCLGRPWLFAQLEQVFRGQSVPPDPGLAEVVALMRRHVELLSDFMGPERGPRDFRKHVAWYLKGFSVKHHVRVGLANVSTLAEFDELVSQIDLDQPFPSDLADKPRGRTAGAKRVALPEGWLESRSLYANQRSIVTSQDTHVSGG